LVVRPPFFTPKRYTMEYTGTVVRVDERTGTSHRGPWTMYTLVLNSSNGETKIGVGFTAPRASPGQVVSISADTNSKGYLDGDLNTLKVLSAAAAPATTSAGQTPHDPGAPSPVDQRQKSIVSQSSYKTAADVLAIAITSGAIKLPSAKTANSGQLDVLLSALDEIAQHVYNCTIYGLEVQEITAPTDEGDYDPTS